MDSNFYLTFVRKTNNNVVFIRQTAFHTIRLCKNASENVTFSNICFLKFIFAAFYVKFKHEIFLTKNLTTFDGHYSLHSIKIENCNGIKKLYNSIEFLGLKFKYFSVSYS